MLPILSLTSYGSGVHSSSGTSFRTLKHSTSGTSRHFSRGTFFSTVLGSLWQVLVAILLQPGYCWASSYVVTSGGCSGSGPCWTVGGGGGGDTTSGGCGLDGTLTRGEPSTEGSSLSVVWTGVRLGREV